MLRRLALVIVGLASALVVCGSGGAEAAPPLYVYEGAGCEGLAKLPQFEALIGRPVDGVVDFNDYTLTAPKALAQLNWQLGCWQSGRVRNIAISIGLKFNGMTMKSIVAGDMDAIAKQMGQALVAHGFRRAYIRLGWEMNGGWYGWGNTGALYAAAFNRLAPILKSGCPDCTIVFNPTIDADPTPELPGAANIGAMGLDVYATSWLGGKQTEPELWTNNLNGWQGIATIGSPYHSLPVVVPEFGVGSRSDGHGACSGKTATACDDPVYMADALAYFAHVNAAFVGYWDYDAGDYNSKISDGSRPHQAAAFLEVYGSAGMKALLHAMSAPFTTQTPPTVTCTNCHAALIQTAPSRWMICIQALDPHPSATVNWGQSTNADLYDPGGASPTTPIKALKTATSWTGVLTPGRPIVIAISQ
jgi:hypothetical protein